jgi:hypothetical protein
VRATRRAALSRAASVAAPMTRPACRAARRRTARAAPPRISTRASRPPAARLANEPLAARRGRPSERIMRCAIVLLVVIGATGCGGATEIVPLLSAAGIPLTEPTRFPPSRDALHGGARSAGHARLRSHVRRRRGGARSRDRVGHRSLGRLAPQRCRRHGWLAGVVEVTNDDAWYEDGRVLFSVGVRATLRGRAGNVYLAQTQASRGPSSRRTRSRPSPARR